MNPLRAALYTAIIMLFQFLANPGLLAQQKDDHLSYKDRQKFERLYIDASKAKMLSEYEQAAKLYESCKKLDNKAPAVYYELANLYLHFGRLEEALENSREAARMDEKNIYYRIMYAECLKAAENLKEAGSEYQDIIKDFPSQYGVYLDLAMIHIALKQSGKAIDVYNDLEKAFGPIEEVKLKKQYLYLQMGQVEKAAGEIQDLIDLFPENVEYYLLLAELYSANEMEEKAVKAYQEASEKFPEEAEIHLSLARYFTGKKQYKKGIEHFRKAFSSPDLDVDIKVQTLLSLFDVANRDGGYSEDIEELGRILLVTHPGDARVLTLNGDIQINLGRQAEAREYFKRAVKVDASRYPIWNQLLILDAELDYFDSLIADAGQAVELFPYQPVCFYFLGYAHGRKEAYTEAIEAYEQGLKQTVDNDLLKLQFYLGLGDAYHEIEEHEKSDKAFEDAIKIDPDNTIALNNYSYYLSIRGEKLEKALEMSGRTLKLEGNSATYLDTYAWILYRMGKFKEAKENLQKALDSGGSNSGVILEHMGDACYQLGEKEKAFEYWNKASKKSDVSELLEKKLKDGTLYE